MLWLLVIVLGIASVILFSRLQQAERRIDELEQRYLDHTGRLLALSANRNPDAEAEQSPADEPQFDPVPAVTLRRSEEPVLVEEPLEPAPELRPEPVEPEPVREPFTSRFTLDFEDIFGRRLPIWAGGITLAVAGVFLVRYSIEAGLLTPVVRVAMSFFFGAGLLAGAEAAYRFEDRVKDERVRQALAGAGLATLYAAFYLAGTQYELIGQTVAFLGLAGVTALAIFLSYRFGLPSAVLGLVGGFAAPALVGGEDANLPMLALYLALVTGGLTQTANRQKRSWLGLAALAGGIGWGGLMLLGGDYGAAEIAALGLYFIVLGTVVPALLDIKQFEQPVRLAASGFAGLQLAILVDAGGYQPLAWGFYLLLGAALAWFGWQKPEMRAGSTMAAVIALVLFNLWPSSAPVAHFLVAAGTAGLFACVPLALLRWKDGALLEALTAAAVPLGLGLISATKLKAYGDVPEIGLGAGLIALAAIPAAAAFVVWTRHLPGALAANLGSASLLLFLGSALLLPDTWAPFSSCVIALGLAYLLRERANDGRSLPVLQWLAAWGTLFAVLVTNEPFVEIERLIEGAREGSIFSSLRWLAAALPFAAIALVRREGTARAAAEFMVGLVVFAALGQVLPPVWLVWTATALVAAICLRMPGRPLAAAALVLCSALWAILPASDWINEGLHALAGTAMLATKLPSVGDALGLLLPFSIGTGLVAMVLQRRIALGIDLRWLALPFGLIVVHTLFKQVLMIDAQQEFAELGLLERTLWQALLLACGWAAWKGLHNLAAASALAGIALVHLVYFTVLLHNPLWAHQAVGQVPVANLVLAAYGIGIASLLSLRRWWPKTQQAADTAIMLLATLGAISLLRQVFAGPYLDILPMSQTEDLLRSLVGILLAIGFLLIGSARGDRLWRVGSLVLMTGTVLKVFIVDTAGLEGLLRIASFVALGASLIGIGWFYSRQLKAAPSEQ